MIKNIAPWSLSIIHILEGLKYMINHNGSNGTVNSHKLLGGIIFLFHVNLHYNSIGEEPHVKISL